MIKCVIQCADVHVKNYQRHEEYAEQLSKFVTKCREIASNYKREEVRIVICGDIVHSKNVISNELMSFVSGFLRALEEIATVIVISGNHDMLVNNMSRKDTLTALFETAKFNDCKFLDGMLNYESGCVEDDDVVWALYSIFDDYRRPDIESISEGKRVIGLYHGTIVGATLNNGTVIDSGVDGDKFNGCDCVMCGDIHKRQVLRRNGVEIVYSGSLIQQTFGETITQHGFVLWDFESGSHEFIDLESDYGLYKVEISDISDLDEDKEILDNL